ncbi:MAG: 6-bladed beta-propeller [Bacteroidaceae bacterium]|nr:6-bladed beta-propeller [Bacteroidaceae bacterium]
MKPARIFIFLLCFGGVLAGCSMKEQSDTLVANHELSVEVSNSTSYKLPSSSESMTLIPLQTAAHCLIGEVDKLYMTADYIIVYDQRNNRIFLFDKAGNFVRQIGQKGDGPEEYNAFSDVVYDYQTERIYAFERFREKMYVYSLEGTLEKVIPSEFGFNSFIKSEKGYWIYSCFKKNNPEHHLLMHVDEELSQVYGRFFPQENINTVHFTSRFTENRTDGSRYFYFDGSDVIWRLSDTAEPFAHVDFGAGTLPYEEMACAKDIDSYDKLVHRATHVGFIDNVQVSDDWLFFNCSESGLNKGIAVYTVNHNLKEKTTHIYKDMMLKSSDLSLEYRRLLQITQEGDFVYMVSPQKLNRYELYTLQGILPQVDEESNPVIVLMKAGA